MESNDGPLFFALVVLGFAICAMAATAAFQSSAKNQPSDDEWRRACLSKGGSIVARSRLGPKAMVYTDYTCEVPK